MRLGRCEVEKVGRWEVGKLGRCVGEKIEMVIFGNLRE